MSEHDDAKKLANAILDRPYADPDDDIAVLARNFLRAEECVEHAKASLGKSWYFEMVKAETRAERAETLLREALLLIRTDVFRADRETWRAKVRDLLKTLEK